MERGSKYTIVQSSQLQEFGFISVPNVGEFLTVEGDNKWNFCSQETKELRTHPNRLKKKVDEIYP